MTNTSGPVLKSKPRFVVEWNDGTLAQNEGTAGLRLARSADELKKAGLKGGVTVSLTILNEDGTPKVHRRVTVTQALEAIQRMESGA